MVHATSPIASWTRLVWFGHAGTIVDQLRFELRAVALGAYEKLASTLQYYSRNVETVPMITCRHVTIALGGVSNILRFTIPARTTRHDVEREGDRLEYHVSNVQAHFS
jgi:hypothetical protein